MRKILIVNANYYDEITKKLVSKAKAILKKERIQIFIVSVPGIFEIPIIIKKNIKMFDAFIAIGCVIKGKTPHFDFICRSTFDSIMKLSVDFKKPIGNGIITALNKKQALERCSLIRSKKPNKGSEAASAVLSILNNGPKKI